MGTEGPGLEGVDRKQRAGEEGQWDMPESPAPYFLGKTQFSGPECVQEVGERKLWSPLGQEFCALSTPGGAWATLELDFAYSGGLIGYLSASPVPRPQFLILGGHGPVLHTYLQPWALDSPQRL